MDKGILKEPVEEGKMNSHFQQILNGNKKSSQASGTSVQQQPHKGHPSGQSPDGPMGGDLMTWTTMLESITYLFEHLGEPDQVDDLSGATPTPSEGYDKKQILKQLAELFTPILVTQGFEADMADQMKAEYQESGVMTERNIIQFDDDTRMAQLISVCAILIQRAKNTEKYQTYEKAAQIRNQLKLEMQKEEYEDAKALAQEFLVHVATTNNSSIARKAANDLLPATQH